MFGSHVTDPDEQRRIDCMKASTALLNGHSMVRIPAFNILQCTDWQEELFACVQAAAECDKPSILYCDSAYPKVYDVHRLELKRMIERPGPL